MTHTQENKKTPRRPIRCLDTEQQQKLWDYLTAGYESKQGVGSWSRDVCIILLMLDAGLRIAEVCGLRRSDLWFGEGPVIDLTVSKTIAKNGIERTVPLSDRLRESIKKLHYNHWYAERGVLMHPALHGSYSNEKITSRQIQRIVKAITTASIGMAFNPHALRHTFATKMMHLTDIRTVQMLLGHASLTSTQIYTHPTLEDLREAINKTNGHPVTKPVTLGG